MDAHQPRRDADDVARLMSQRVRSHKKPPYLIGADARPV
jgi:hypothetical protein